MYKDTPLRKWARERNFGKYIISSMLNSLDTLMGGNLNWVNAHFTPIEISEIADIMVAIRNLVDAWDKRNVVSRRLFLNEFVNTEKECNEKDSKESS